MNRTVLTRALCTALCLAICAVGLAPAATAAETRTISGSITMPGITDPLALDAATVSVTPQAGGSAISVNVTSSGTFAATGLAPGAYVVCAVPNSYTNASGVYGKPYNVLVTCMNTVNVFGTRGTVDVTAGDFTGITLAMSAGSTVSGTVTLPAGADPELLRGVYAHSLMYVTNGFTTTEAMVNPDTGAYVLSGLYPGTHEITFKSRSYVDPATGATVTPPFWTVQYPGTVTVDGSHLTGINGTLSVKAQATEFLVAPKPQLVGDPLVGQTLTAVTGEWQPTPSSLDYVWTRGGTIISGATGPTYVVTEADLNTTLYVRVTGSAAGLSNKSVESERVWVRSTFTTLGTPTITGTAAQGSTLTCAPGAWTPTPTSVTYKWTRGGLAISGATGATYTLQASDAGTQVRCAVTAALPPYPEVTRTSAAVVPLKSFATPGSIAVSGEANLGSTLTASVTGNTPAASSIDFRWFRNGTAIPGATSSTYEVTAADSLSTLSVTGTLKRSGYSPAAATAASVSVPKLFAAAPGVQIAGTMGLGETLTAQVPAWTPAATLAYQWLRNGTPIGGAQGSSYVLTVDDQDATIGVRVVGSAPTYTPVVRTASVVTKKFFLSSPAPTIDGHPVLGSTLRALLGGWNPSAIHAALQWRRDGQPIGAGAFYTVTEADLGHTVTVTVTGSYNGYHDAVRVSAPLAVPLGRFSPSESAPLPVISGGAQVGVELSASPATLSPAATGLAYQWLRDGAAISGASDVTYTPTAADAGAALSVRVTASRTGYETLELTATPQTVARGVFATRVPTVSGTLRAGYTLKATAGTWTPSATSYSYRWYRNGVAISGATESTYKLTTTDRGKKITVTVTGKRSGYTTATATSVAKAVLNEFTKTVTPTITGTAKAGSTLTAVRGSWSPTPVYSYQWYRSGVKITGATSYRYMLTSVDKGKKITVKVTGKKSGYFTVTKTSASKTIAR